MRNTSKILGVKLEGKNSTRGCWDMNTNSSENRIFLFWIQLALDKM